jgi:phosphoribosylformimino-5-aminoimidazole carboxamide ribotide isomerase
VSKMIIIPAIDLKDGRCVRLRQGKMDSPTVFGEDPAAQARLWASLGARRIHVVDLDGSVGGRPLNLHRVEQIVAAVKIPVQLGGGIRNADTAAMYLDAGVATVILGTLAAREPSIAAEIIARFPGRVAVGIDARAGMVAVQGWTESTAIRAVDLAARFEPAQPECFIYTDIERDGMMRGPNIQATREFAQRTTVPVVLSGGVSTMEDVTGALALEPDGVTAVIIGRALYEGTVDLAEAIRLSEGPHVC